MDKFSPEKRSAIMRAVGSRDTKVEIAVRSRLHRAGLRFSLHRKELPGTPDVVLRRHRAVVFVHGCFWHGHGCRRGRRPKSRTEFWNAKLDANVARDRRNRRELAFLGWRVFVVWECEWKRGADCVVCGLHTDLRPISGKQLSDPSKPKPMVGPADISEH